MILVRLFKWSFIHRMKLEIQEVRSRLNPTAKKPTRKINYSRHLNFMNVLIILIVKLNTLIIKINTRYS